MTLNLPQPLEGQRVYPSTSTMTPPTVMAGAAVCSQPERSVDLFGNAGFNFCSAIYLFTCCFLQFVPFISALHVNIFEVCLNLGLITVIVHLCGPHCVYLHQKELNRCMSCVDIVEN